MQAVPRLALRQSPSLAMTPRLGQAIRLLRLSNADVAAYVAEQAAANPLLRVEAAPWPDHAVSRHRAAEHREPDQAGSPRSLRDELAQQLRLGVPDATDRAIGAWLIDGLDPAGRVVAPDAEIAAKLGVPAARVAAMRERMGGFEPAGLFARDLRGCLAAQLRERNQFDEPMRRLLDNLPLLAARDLGRLRLACGVAPARLDAMVATLRRLDPKPGTALDEAPFPAILPDLRLRDRPGGGWDLELVADHLPRITVDDLPARPGAASEALAEQRLAARWLVRSLRRRADTLLAVTAEIVRRQDGFLRHGPGQLRPLALREVAGALHLHESTVSRVAAGKHVLTPHGLHPLRAFFTAALGANDAAAGAEAVRHRLRALVAAEAPGQALSDAAIVAQLRREGVDIARRTVAKYRDALRIPTATRRMRVKAGAA